MRDVEVVKQMRDDLRDKMIELIDLRIVKYGASVRHPDLPPYDQKVFSYLMGATNKLKTQINTLEFVLNEDTMLNDATDTLSSSLREMGCTKESIINELRERVDYHD